MAIPPDQQGRQSGSPEQPGPQKDGIGAGNPANGSSAPGDSPPTPAVTPSRRLTAPLPPPPRYESSVGALRQILFGRPLSSALSGHQKLPKLLALPIFSSDALSSVAYATEAIFGTLILASTAALQQSIGIGFAICALILIVTLSYRQLIFAYPNGGGAYPVGKENLGTIAALTAGAALLVDYILTVAVSVASGVDAVASFSSTDVNWLSLIGGFVHTHTVEVCVLATLGVMLANLRGVRESGTIFAFPAYIFITSFTIMIAVGGWMYATGRLHWATTAQLSASAAQHGLKVGTMLAGTYLVLQGFSSGCSALTGMEAIANTTPYFKEPQAKNASQTMGWMAGIAIFFFLGITLLANLIAAVPIDSKAEDYQTVISQIAHRVFDNTYLAWFYYIVQISTSVILILAANTAFSGFPALGSMLARDRFLPRQLASVGDRLVYANGIVLLGLVSCLLLVVFGGNVYELIPLYAVGVFTSFTIAQAGMVRLWLKKRTPGWQYSITLNAVGAVATAIVAAVFVVSKWASGVVISPYLRLPTDGVFQWTSAGYHHWTIYAYRAWRHAHPGQALPGFTIGPQLVPHYGAWIVVVIIPIFVMIFLAINEHYMDAERQLALTGPEPFRPVPHTVVVLIPRLHRGVIEALRYAQTISDDARALCVEIDESSTAKLKEQWEEYSNGVPLLILASSFRSLFGPILRFVDAILRDDPGHKLTIVVPEFVSQKWWHNILHNNSGLMLKYVLSNKRNVIVTNVRYFLES